MGVGPEVPVLNPPTVSCSQELLASRCLVSTPVPNCLNRRAPASLLRPHWEQVEGCSCDHYNSKKRRSLSDTCRVMSQGKSLTCLPFPPSSLLRSQRSRPRSRPRGPAACCTKTASAPSCTCCLARRALLPGLCMLSCARQGPARASPSVSHPLQAPCGQLGRQQHRAGGRLWGGIRTSSGRGRENTAREVGDSTLALRQRGETGTSSSPPQVFPFPSR